jgi:type VI secretion system protein ImpL
LVAVVAETDLARPEDAGETAAEGPPKGLSKVLGKLGKLGKLAKKGAKFIPPAEGGAPLDTSGQQVSDHFQPLRAAVAEVDGQPPALDPVVAALTALSNVLQTVSASPDPEIAIKNQGGLAELTGAVAEQAKILPDPLDDWIAGLASDTTAITEQAVVKKLNAIWQSDVLGFCKAALVGRYPFDANGVSDVNTADFQRLFGPGGLIDSFTNDHLLTYVDTASRPWRWRADLGLDDSALAALERARRIRDALFPGGNGPLMTFNLTPTDLSPNASAVTLNLDGQSLTYLNSAARGMQMTWPGKDQTGVITLAFRPVEPKPEVMTRESGAWAWLRLLRGGNLRPSDRPDLFRLRLSSGGFYADFDLQAASVDNPFDLQMFSRFSCPDRI